MADESHSQTDPGILSYYSTKAIKTMELQSSKLDSYLHDMEDIFSVILGSWNWQETYSSLMEIRILESELIKMITWLSKISIEFPIEVIHQYNLLESRYKTLLLTIILSVGKPFKI